MSFQLVPVCEFRKGDTAMKDDVYAIKDADGRWFVGESSSFVTNWTERFCFENKDSARSRLFALRANGRNVKLVHISRSVNHS
jgi:hypothetical protein